MQSLTGPRATATKSQTVSKNYTSPSTQSTACLCTALTRL